MPIIVKKPFSFSIEDVRSKDIKDINTKVINAANEQQIHPEFEEKPVVESMTQTSEDVHGGSELTFSLPNSSQSSGQEQEQKAVPLIIKPIKIRKQHPRLIMRILIMIMIMLLIIMVMIRVPRNNKMLVVKSQMIIMRWEITRLIQM